MFQFRLSDGCAGPGDTRVHHSCRGWYGCCRAALSALGLCVCAKPLGTLRAQDQNERPLTVPSPAPREASMRSQTIAAGVAAAGLTLSDAAALSLDLRECRDHLC